MAGHPLPGGGRPLRAAGAICRHEGEAEVNAHMVQRADCVVVVAAGATLGRRAFARICATDRIDMLVTDRSAPEQAVSAVRAAGITVEQVCAATAGVAGVAGVAGLAAGDGRHTGRMPLHCPARLYIARHGEAGYPHGDGILSDDGGWLTDAGREQVRSCAESLRADRIAAVHTSPLERAVESGRIASPILSVQAEVTPGLVEVAVGDSAGRPWADSSLRSVYGAWMAGDLQARIPGAETGAEVIARFRDAVESIADRFRGEQVLLFSHGGVMSFVIPRLATNTSDALAYQAFIPHAVPAVVEVGDEGWQVVSWPGSPDTATR